MHFPAPPPQTEDEPWRRLVGKVVERAVLDLLSGNQPAWERTDTADFLVDKTVRALCDTWGLWLPWDKIRVLAQQSLEKGERDKLICPEMGQEKRQKTIVKSISPEKSERLSPTTKGGSVMNELHKIAADFGFGGFKIAEVQGGEMKVAAIPSVVGIGSTDTGMLSTGFKRSRQAKPLTVSFDELTYLVGPNVHLYARPVERLDFQRLSEGPELRALLYAALWRIINGGSHTIALMVGLPVEVVQDRALAQETLRKLRGWVIGEHRLAVNGQRTTVEITQVKAIAQPVGTYFAWGMDVNGQWKQNREALNSPVGVCDIGFNTLDLFAVEEGQVAGRFTGGDNLGMHRVADTLIRHVRRTYSLSLSLHQADGLMREYLKRGQVTLYHAGGEADLSQAVEQALNDAFAGVSQFIRQHWERGLQFRHLLITGGGAQAMQSRLLAQYPQAIILPASVTANAEGMAKFAVQPRVFGG